MSRFGRAVYASAVTTCSAELGAGCSRPVPRSIVHAHSYHSLAALAAGFSYRGPFVFTPHYHGTGHTGFARSLAASIPSWKGGFCPRQPGDRSAMRNARW